jgi:hypothetical protein
LRARKKEVVEKKASLWPVHWGMVGLALAQILSSYNSLNPTITPTIQTATNCAYLLYNASQNFNRYPTLAFGLELWV